ncbi:MAG: transcriptional regulator [Candidatus Melainabacteria bacterium]|nr:MAG: transcriptional regulator [Candidatus Melainabacteria bacterium]
MANSEATPRSPCVFSNVLDILGDRWTLLIVRDLFFFGKHEYKEFLSSPEAIATNILASRLQKLVCAGIIDEMPHPQNKSRKLYFLTERGKDLLPMLVEMAKWGEKHLTQTEVMRPLFEVIRRDAAAFQRKVLRDLKNWEKANLA